VNYRLLYLIVVAALMVVCLAASIDVRIGRLGMSEGYD
jgi:hypothetical protein